MATTKEVIKDALENVLVQAEEEPIEAPTAQSSIRYLNDRMTAWDAIGITLGYTIVSQLSDIVTVPAGALMGIKAQLSIDIADQYKAEVRPGTFARATEGFKAIQNLSDLTANSMEYPSTLPVGSGNQSDTRDDPFYPDRQNTILTETGGSIALEESTEESG